jgi:predicted site-specific integrase-resolvase
MKTEIFIDLVEAARRLRVAYQTAYRWALEGKLIATRKDGRWLVEETSVNRMAEIRRELEHTA